METKKDEKTVTVNYRTAQLIRRCFLPKNPNKMRSHKIDPEVEKAVREFISAVETA